jgi:small GTP-binding protein
LEEAERYVQYVYVDCRREPLTSYAKSLENLGDCDVKVVVVGDSGVGKSCLLVTYINNAFPTANVSVAKYDTNVMIRDKPCNVSFTDTPGHEDYVGLRRVLISTIQQDLHVFVICFDLNNRASFENVLSKWIPELKGMSKDIPFVILGTKSDLNCHSSATTDGKEETNKPNYRELSRDWGQAAYLECSSLLGQNVKECITEALVVGQNCLIKKQLEKKRHYLENLTVEDVKPRDSSQEILLMTRYLNGVGQDLLTSGLLPNSGLKQRIIKLIEVIEMIAKAAVKPVVKSPEDDIPIEQIMLQLADLCQLRSEYPQALVLYQHVWEREDSKSAFSKFANAAQYGIAEVHCHCGRLEEALAAFGRVSGVL